MGVIKVHQFWREARSNDDFHEWKPQEWWDERFPTMETQRLLEALQEQCICIQRGHDKLRWGYLPRGDYSTKEAYELNFNQEEYGDKDSWGKV